jgi:hypothetical protein
VLAHYAIFCHYSSSSKQSFSYLPPSWNPDPNIVYWLAVAPSLSTRLSCRRSYALLHLLVLAFYLRPSVLSTVMDSFPEHSSKPASQAEPTIEEIRKWNEDELLMQIQQKRPGLLRDRNLEKFKEAFIDGDTFLDHASDVEFFEAKCHQPIGISARLAKLAREMAGGETTGKSIDHTPLLFALYQSILQ